MWYQALQSHCKYQEVILLLTMDIMNIKINYKNLPIQTISAAKQPEKVAKKIPLTLSYPSDLAELVLLFKH